MRARLAGAAALLGFLALSSEAAWAKAGDLDRTYGPGTGVARIDFGSLPGATKTADFAENLALQPDGRVVVAGDSDAMGTDDIAVARLLERGTLDTSFAAGTARALINLGSLPGAPTTSTIDRGYSVAVRDGRILVGGSSDYFGDFDMAIVRLTSAGVLDSSFGGSGVSLAGFGTGSTDVAWGMALQQDGRIVVAGPTTATPPYDFGIARVLSPQAIFDPSFVSGVGRKQINFGSLPTATVANSADQATSVAMQGDKIVVAGNTNMTGTYDMAIARLASNGDLDTGYGLGTGASRVDFGGLPGATKSNDGADAVAIQPDGRIVVAGTSDALGTNGMAVARVLSPQGTFDASFANGRGRTIISLGGPALAQAIALQPDGKILLAGSVEGPGGSDIAVVRLQPNGLPDTSFGTDGKSIIDVEGGKSVASGIALRADGKILVSGWSTKGTNTDMVVVRLEGDPGAGGGGPGGGPAKGGRPPRCAGKRATLVGTNGKNRLRGTRRADVIVGLRGNDRISGLRGNDVVCAGAGNDRVDGGDGNDRLAGGGGNDRLIGKAGKDRLSGDAGKDTLLGGAGRDRLKGGPGKDKQKQ